MGDDPTFCLLLFSSLLLFPVHENLGVLLQILRYMHRSVIYGLSCILSVFLLCLRPISHRRRKPRYGLENHETRNIKHFGGKKIPKHKKQNPKSPGMPLSKILGVVLGVTSKNLGKDKRYLTLTGLLLGCFLNYALVVIFPSLTAKSYYCSCP